MMCEPGLRFLSPNTDEGTTKKGFTLIEVMVYLAVLYVVIGIMYSIFYRANKVIKLNNDYLTTLSVVNQVKGRLEKDIHSAVKVVSSIDNFTTGPDELILAVPGRTVSDNEGLNYVIYTFNQETRKWRRVYLESSPEGFTEYSRFLNYRINQVKFSYASEDLTSTDIIHISIKADLEKQRKIKNIDIDFSVSLRPLGIINKIWF